MAIVPHASAEWGTPPVAESRVGVMATDFRFNESTFGGRAFFV